MHQLFFRRLQVHRDHEALDQFGDLSANHVRTKQLTRLLVEDDLDHALVFAERDRLAVGAEGVAADADIAAFRLRLGFR